VEGVGPEILGVKFEARLGQEVYEVTIETQPGAESEALLEVTLKRGDVEENYEVKLLGQQKGRLTLEFDHAVEDFLVSQTEGRSLVDWRNKVFPLEIYDPREKIVRQSGSEDAQGEVALRAQMPGKVIRLLKRTGDPVDVGEGTVVVEAMKMQNEIRSPKKGTVVSCDLREGDSVKAGDLLLRIE